MTEFRLTCRVLEAQIAILDAYFTGNTSSCTSTTVGTGTKTATARPPFLVEDDNETSVTLNSSTPLRTPREAVSSDKKQITLPVKHRYVADYATRDKCSEVKEFSAPKIII
jgi:hypothetical protein